MNDNSHGVMKIYRDSGALWVETPYVNGTIRGLQKVYRQ